MARKSSGTGEGAERRMIALGNQTANLLGVQGKHGMEKVSYCKFR
jgi:hypothetical protein